MSTLIRYGLALLVVLILLGVGTTFALALDALAKALSPEWRSPIAWGLVLLGLVWAVWVVASCLRVEIKYRRR